MRLLTAQVIGFQSFADSGVVTFEKGITLIVGQNNSGKSAFLRALQINLQDDRHRSPAASRQHQLAQPRVALEIEVTGRELQNAILRTGAEWRFSGPTSGREEWLEKELFSQPSLRFDLYRNPGG